jgi:hypothetical protein
MKRTTATVLLLAGLGGCMTTDGQKKRSASTAPRSAGETSERMTAYVQKKGTKGAKAEPKIQQASANVVEDAQLQGASGLSRIVGGGSVGCETCATCDTGVAPQWGSPGGHFRQGGGDPYAFGPMGHGIGTMMGNNGIMPVPAMGVPGAVAAVGAIGQGSPYGPTISNQRTSIKFVSPDKARIGWLVNGSYADTGLVAPASYNFMQGNIYRLKVSGVPTQPSKVYYPTLEVAPSSLKTITYLSHNSVPVSFTNDDFERVNAGNLVVKVIYLPDPAFQDAAALGGAEEVVSTQLEPGADPIVEATRRGTVLAVIRIGNINLENPNSPAMDAVGGPPMATMPAATPPTAATPRMLPAQPVTALPSIPQVR